MFTKRTKLIIGLSQFLGSLLCILFVLGSIGIKIMSVTTDNSSGQRPRRKVNITIDTNEQEKLFDQLRNFATQQAFTILIDTRPSGIEGFYIDLYRDDIEISGTNPFAPGEYELGIYDADRLHPVSESILDHLVRDLKDFVGKVPSATFSLED